MEVEHLLDEFPPVATSEWEDAILKDLKGADYARKLIWNSPEGIQVKPYYRQEDVAGLLGDEVPGSFPYMRGTRATGNWRIREEIDAADLEEANCEAQNSVTAGAEEISFRRAEVKSDSDLALLLVNLQSVPLHFENADTSLVELLCERVRRHSGSLEMFAKLNPLENVQFSASIIPKIPTGLVPFTISAEDLEEQGATAVHEVAFPLAAGIEYLAAMDSRRINVDSAARALGFSFSTGASFFFQIAKFRSFRMLWSQAVTSFGGKRVSSRTRLYAHTSPYTKTAYDPYVNVLRATTEAMSAVLGGADSVCIAAFDECYKTPDEGSRRLARNTQLVLKHEALLTHVADPGAGSYYLESITESVAREAWKMMQQIEAAGGYSRAAADGLLEELLRTSRKEKAMMNRRRVFTGTNQYANPEEKILGKIDPARVEADRRAAIPFEQLRLRTERFAAETGKTPRVLLAEFGDVKMRAARSNFASNFFACAGFEIITQRIENVDAVAESEADLIVLCSADAAYFDMATVLIAKLKSVDRGTPVIVAGLPETVEQLRAVGVSDFIHIRSNPIEMLTRCQQRLGMRI